MTIVLALTAASAASGCSTFSDNDAAARVNDIELSSEQLTELAEFIPDGATGGPSTPGDAEHARNAIRVWVEAQALAAAELDIPVGESDRDAATEQLAQFLGFTELSDATRSLLVRYVATRDALSATPDGGALIEQAVLDADVYVDPRLGTFDAQFGIIPLG